MSISGIGAIMEVDESHPASSESLEDQQHGPKLSVLAMKSLQSQDLKLVSSSIKPDLADINRVAYKKVEITDNGGEAVEDFVEICQKLKTAMDLRTKYMQLSYQAPGMNPADDPALVFDALNFVPPCDLPLMEPSNFRFEMKEGVFRIFNPAVNTDVPFCEIPSLTEFLGDLDMIIGIESDGPVKTFAFKRMGFLESLFDMHLTLNELEEQAICKCVPHRDFYNVRKVDTHVHHSACMNQKHLLRFIKAKLKKSPKEVVMHRDGHELTLEQVFESLGLTAYHLSIDALDMHAHKDSYHRFDKFNLKYNPIGESRLREIFLKTDNFIKGKYLAELTKEVISDLEESKYQMAEYRMSIYGKNPNEFHKLADWFCENRLFSPNVRWFIQVPRLYVVYKSSGLVSNFEEFLSNIFKPLFEVTVNPEKHPNLFKFLKHVVAFDSVDDESKATKRLTRNYPPPNEWDFAFDPPYAYYQYYMYANIATLNQLRATRGLNTFKLRPHAGEAGSEPHENLTATFLLAHSINHGILLRKVPALMYLYYLMQIGVAVSPLSNNALFLTYDKNPFPSFFKKGLNVSLSTDDPLQFHYTKEPLIEEYSVAAQIWKFSPTDMSEVARNSVLQSGFELCVKKAWIGDNCMKQGPEGNDIQKTNVPNIRLAFREDNLKFERQMLARGLRKTSLSECGSPSDQNLGKRKFHDVALQALLQNVKKSKSSS